MNRALLDEENTSFKYSRSTSDLPDVTRRHQQRACFSAELPDHRRRKSATALETLGHDAAKILSDAFHASRLSRTSINGKSPSFPVNEPRNLRRVSSGRNRVNSLSPGRQKQASNHCDKRSRSTSSRREKSAGTTRDRSSSTRRDKSNITSSTRERSKSTTRDRSTGATRERSHISPGRRGRSSSQSKGRNSYPHGISSSSSHTIKKSSKSPKRNSTESTNDNPPMKVPKPTMERNRSAPSRVDNSDRVNRDSNNNSQDEAALVGEEMDASSNRRNSLEGKRMPKNPSRELRTMSTSQEGKRGRPKTRRPVKSSDKVDQPTGLQEHIKSTDTRMDHSRKSRSTSTSKTARAKSGSASLETSSSLAEASVRKSRNTALTLFDKSSASEESFSKRDDEARRLVKEAGFIEASEYISNPRSRSASVNRRSRSTSLSQRSGLDDADDGFKVLRSASLSRPKTTTDYDTGVRKAPGSESLNRRKEPSSTIKGKRSSKKQAIYFPQNEPRTGVRRRWSLSDTISMDGDNSTTAAVLESDSMSTASEDISVGRRQTTLDILATPSTSRPMLRRSFLKALPPPPEPAQRSRRNASREGPRNSSNENRRRRSKSRNQETSQDQSLSTLTSMTPSMLPNLLSPQFSDDEYENGGDSQQNLLENISISDIMSPVRGRSILEKIANDASLALTARWQSVPVISAPFPEEDSNFPTCLDSSDYRNEGDLSSSSRANSPRPERDARRRSKRERKERIEKIEKALKDEERRERARRGEKVVSPLRQESLPDKRERKQMDSSNKSIDPLSSYRRPSTASSQRRRQTSSRSRSRSKSRSLSRSARTRQSIPLYGPDGSNYHRRVSSIFTPKCDAESGESDTSERMGESIEPVKRQSVLTIESLYGGSRVETGASDGADRVAEEHSESDRNKRMDEVSEPGVKRQSILTIESLYGGGRVENVDSKASDRLAGQGSKKKNIRSASLSPMRNSQRYLKAEDDLDAVYHGGKMLSAVSETGHRIRTSSTNSRRRLLESGAVDTEAVKRDGRTRLAKERKNRTNVSSASDLEASDKFSKSNGSSMELSHESMSSVKSTGTVRGKASSAMNPQQQQRRRRHTVAKDMLHKSITSIPELEKMPASDHISQNPSSGHGGQVWQRRRRNSVGKDEASEI